MSPRLPSLLLFALILCASESDAQDTAATATGVADTACTYDKCVLWFNGTRLVRGLHGERLARPGGFLTPMPLLRFVAGDSATYYASRYERDADRVAILTIGGLAMTTAAVFTMHTRCNGPFPSSGCDSFGTPVVLLLVGGLAFDVASIPVAFRARRAQARAILWNNRRYAR